jgi:serine/threonine-protein kinase
VTTSSTEIKIQLVDKGGFLGRHRILAQLGQGGMADVLLAVAPGPVGLNKLVVIKRLRDNVQDSEFAEMFLNEAHIAARLNHPNVIHTYEVAQDEAQLYLVMEYLDGQPLQRVRGRIPATDYGLGIHLRILCDSLLGLHYAHELVDYNDAPLGIVHRDISPQNLFVTYEGTTKVLDFGIAKALNQAVHTRVGGIKGKIRYMSPEQAKGTSHELDRRSDVFATGILLWEAITGRRLWDGIEDVVVFQRLLRGEAIESPRHLKPDIPVGLERICMRALNIDRERRYENAEALRLDLEAFILDRKISVSAVDVGRFLSAEFSQERESIRSTIDNGLRNSSSSSRVWAGGSGTGTGTGTRNADALSERGAPMGRLTQPSSLMATEVSTSFAKRSFNSWWRYIAIGTLSVAGSAVAWALVSHNKPEPRPVAEVSLPTKARPATVSQEPAVKSVLLNVTVSPSSARLMLDGQYLGTGTFRGHVPKSQGKHRIIAESPGYEPAQADIALEADNEVQLTLVSKLTSKAPVKASPPKRTPQPTATPTPKKKPAIVSIDTETPW